MVPRACGVRWRAAGRSRMKDGAAHPSTGSLGYCVQHEMHHHSGSGTTVSDASVSHDAGTT
jgi:hypothetical protein